MSQMTSLSIADGQATPATLTFDIQQAQTGNSPASWLEKSAGVYLGFRKITSTVRRSASSRATRVSIKIADPKLAVTAPASGSGIQPQPTLSYTSLVSIDFVLPDACTPQDRKDIYAFVVNTLAKSIIKDQVIDFSPLY